MEKCINCIHYKACEDWAKSFCSYEETTFPYEAENNLCEYYEPVRRGEWKPYPSDAYMKCSVCGMEYLKSKMPQVVGYCPNCGACMDGGNG